MSIEVTSTSEDGVRTLSEEKETPKIEAKAEVKSEVAEEATEEQTEESDELAAAGEEEEAEVQEEVKPKKKGGFQKKLERKDREIEELKAQLAKAPQQTEVKPSVSYDKAKPKIDDFDSHAEYTEALADWKFDEREFKRDIEQKQAKVVEDINKNIGNYKDKLKEFKKTTPDLDDVLEDIEHIRVNGALADAITLSDVAAELTYELAKNPEEFERINKLSPIQAVKEIAKLELKLQKAADEKVAQIKEEKTKPSKAPAPLKTLAGKAVATVKADINDPDLPFSEYDRLRTAEEIKQKKALRA